MAEIVPGYTTEQKVVTTANTDVAMNAAITTEAADQWLVSSLTQTLEGPVIILFSRVIATPIT